MGGSGLLQGIEAATELNQIGIGHIDVVGSPHRSAWWAWTCKTGIQKLAGLLLPVVLVCVDKVGPMAGTGITKAPKLHESVTIKQMGFLFLASPEQTRAVAQQIAP